MSIQDKLQELAPELFKAWGYADDTAKIYVGNDGRLLVTVATIARPIDYTALINKAVLVRDNNDDPWIPAILSAAEEAHSYYTVAVYGVAEKDRIDPTRGTLYRYCRPFDPDLVGKV